MATAWLGGETYPVTGIPRGWPIGIDTGVTTDFSLITNSTCNVDIDWGDGNVNTGVALSGNTTTTHNYSTPGTYTVEITLNSGDFYPYYNNDAAGDELVTLGDTPAGWSFGDNLQSAFRGSANLTTVGDIDTSAVTSVNTAWDGCAALQSFPPIDLSNCLNFTSAWQSCTSLDNVTALGEQYSFPFIDVSTGTDFYLTWNGCTSLTSFPPLDMSNSTRFTATWRDCSNLLSFPAANMSSATDFYRAWRDCSSMTSVAQINVSSGTNFRQAWINCTSLADFSANVFDTTGVLTASAFTQTWQNCALTAQSIENILVSLDTNGASGIDLGLDGGTNASKATWTAAANTAYDNLIGKSWTISFNP